MARIPCNNLTCPSQIQVTADSGPLGIAKRKRITLAEPAPVRRSRRLRRPQGFTAISSTSKINPAPAGTPPPPIVP
jgi:hypothetical protein